MVHSSVLPARPTRGEEAADPDGAEYSLREDELIVFFAKRRHHQPEDVEKRPGEQEMTRPIVVIDSSDDRTLPLSASLAERIPRRRTYPCKHHE